MSGIIKWFGQAGYLIRTENTTLAIDLYFSDAIASQGFVRAYPPQIKKGELTADCVVSTHNHGDHLDLETLRDYISFQDFYGPTSCVAAMKEAAIEGVCLHTLDRGETVKVGDLTLTAVFADHTPDSIGIVVEACGHKLYFTGDSRFHEQLFDAASLEPDVIFICINGKFGNMSWQDAVTVAKRLNVKTAIPMHYDMFPINSEDPSLFTSAFANSGIRSFTLEHVKEYDISSLI